MRDLGILNEADFGTEATSTYLHHDLFERAFNYAPILTMSSDHVDFFTTIVDEITQQRPVLLSLPGHLTVADGYASDGSGKKIHINLGWGGRMTITIFLMTPLSPTQTHLNPLLKFTIIFNLVRTIVQSLSPRFFGKSTGYYL